jgi:hypothetical protein
MIICTCEPAALFELAKLYRYEALSVHKPESSIAEESPIIIVAKFTRKEAGTKLEIERMHAKSSWPHPLFIGYTHFWVIVQCHYHAH